MLSAEVGIMHNVSIKVDDESYELLQEMAKSGNRSQAAVFHDAIKKQSEFERAEVEAVMIGMKQADADEVISHSEMMDYVEGLNDS